MMKLAKNGEHGLFRPRAMQLGRFRGLGDSEEVLGPGARVLRSACRAVERLALTARRHFLSLNR